MLIGFWLAAVLPMLIGFWLAAALHWFLTMAAVCLLLHTHAKTVIKVPRTLCRVGSREPDAQTLLVTGKEEPHRSAASMSVYW
jgi:hypothetical protein